MTNLQAKPEMIKMWAARTKCWMCKHRFIKPVILPVATPAFGTFQPNINQDVLFHLYETHGLSPGITKEWIIGSVYGAELTEFGMKR